VITQAKRMKLRDQFKGEKGINWMNSQDEPDIDYVEWLEGNHLELSHNSDYTVPASLIPKTCPICEGDGKHQHNGKPVPCSFCNGRGQVFV
jgi:DnaJ-class molecular chaperone